MAEALERSSPKANSLHLPDQQLGATAFRRNSDSSGSSGSPSAAPLLAGMEAGEEGSSFRGPGTPLSRSSSLRRAPSSGTGGAGAASPKRVSFAPEPPPIGSAGASPARPRRLLPPPAVPVVALPAAAALTASDEDIAGRVDMSDVPSWQQAPAGASLARALWDLLPQQQPPRPQDTVSEVSSGNGPTEQDMQHEEGQKGPFASHTAASFPAPTLPPPAAEQEAPPSSLAGRLRYLLSRLMEAAGSSGSSIADLTASSSGMLCDSSWAGSSGSLATLYSADSASTEGSELFGSASSLVAADGWEEAGGKLVAAGDQEQYQEQYRWVSCLSSGFGGSPDPTWA